VAYDGDAGARIGLVPRKGFDDDTIWVDVEPCVVLHTINAYDDDNGNVVLTAMRCMPSGPFRY
jgi:carotenoid cleavage dioxygenase-like enzyme